MPRALTEQEKRQQYIRFLNKGKEIVFSLGIKKTSIDDITKSVGIAKGSFYQYFESKEVFMLAIIMEVHQIIFNLAEQQINVNGDLKNSIRTFLLNLYKTPELMFLSKYNDEINTLISNLEDSHILKAKQFEASLFKKIAETCEIELTNMDISVVSNLIHTLYLINNSELIELEALQQTCELIIDALLSYVFGG
ncbi:MAG: TetR/AcrR family transcriptional regulator [Oscillospiraceae bacterium]|nr:TetR/AcrR family transcriptional regulator [Oscillospiraceae bacterium]